MVGEVRRSIGRRRWDSEWGSKGRDIGGKGRK